MLAWDMEARAAQAGGKGRGRGLTWQEVMMLVVGPWDPGW